MAKRMTWEEITKCYPSQWVGLSDVETKEGNDATVVSAVVKYSDKSADELSLMQLYDTNLRTCHTAPDSLEPMGIMGVMTV